MAEIIGRTSSGDYARKSGNVVLRNHLVFSPGAHFGTRLIIR